MEQTDLDHLLRRTQHLMETVDEKLARSLELDLLERIIRRMQSLNCPSCAAYVPELSAHLARFEDHIPPDKPLVKAYRKTIEAIKAHLQKEHEIVPEGLFMSIYMSVGMSLGVALGLAVFDNLAMGLPIGMLIGLGIGAGLDADKKKKGLTL